MHRVTFKCRVEGLCLPRRRRFNWKRAQLLHRPTRSYPHIISTAIVDRYWESYIDDRPLRERSCCWWLPLWILEAPSGIRCRWVDRAAEARSSASVVRPKVGRSPSYILVITVISLAVGQSQERRSVDKEVVRGRARGDAMRDFAWYACSLARSLARCWSVAYRTRKQQVTIRRRDWRCSSRRATIITELFRLPT